MTTALFMLRCIQIGIHIDELELLTIGMVNDVYAESENDSIASELYCEIATQEQMDAW